MDTAVLVDSDSDAGGLDSGAVFDTDAGDSAVVLDSDSASDDTGLVPLAPGPGDLVITEIMPNPEFCSDSDGEYFEVMNATNSVLDLSSVTVADNISVSGLTAVNGDFLLDPGQAVVFSRSNWCFSVSGVEHYTYLALALSNSGDVVEVLSSGVSIDVVDYNGWAAAPSGVAWELDRGSFDAVANDLESNWCLASSPISTSQDLGSPGVVNDACFGGDTADTAGGLLNDSGLLLDSGRLLDTGLGLGDTSGPGDSGFTPIDTGDTDTGGNDTSDTDTGRFDTSDTDTAFIDTGVDTSDADTGGVDTSDTDTGGFDTSDTDTAFIDTDTDTDTDTAFIDTAIDTDTGGVDTSDTDTGGVDTSDTDTGGVDTSDTDTGGVDTSDTDTGGVDTSDTDTGGVDTSDTDTGGLDTSDTDTGGVDTSDTDTGGVDTSDTDTGGVDTSDTDTGGVDTSDTDTGGLDTSDTDTGGGISPALEIKDDFEGGYDVAVWTTVVGDAASTSAYAANGTGSLNMGGGSATVQSVSVDMSQCAGPILWEYRGKRGPESPDANDYLRLEYWTGLAWSVVDTWYGNGFTDTAFSFRNGAITSTNAYNTDSGSASPRWVRGQAGMIFMSTTYTFTAMRRVVLAIPVILTQVFSIRATRTPLVWTQVIRTPLVWTQVIRTPLVWTQVTRTLLVWTQVIRTPLVWTQVTRTLLVWTRVTRTQAVSPRPLRLKMTLRGV